MMTAKEEALDLIRRLPDESSMEAILAELHFKARIRRGIEQMEAGEVISQEEMEESVRDWLKSPGR